MGTTIIFRRGENDPTSGSGLTLAEPAFNTTLKTFHIGLGHGVTAAWVGAPISGLSADIAAGITYKIPTLAAVKNYIGGLCYGNTGAATMTEYVSSFNGLTGAVTGVTVGGANTFTALNSFNAGISASGATFSGTLSGATATFSSLVTSNGGISGDVNISSTNATGNMYLVMSRGAGVTALFVDDATTPLVYQPYVGNLGVKGLTIGTGNDRLYLTPTQITATNTVTPNNAYFYFVSPAIYLQSGDTAAMAASGSTRQLTWGDFVNSIQDCYFGVNRVDGGMCGDYAVEINHSTGKALQLIYNDYSGAASNWVNMNVTSGGDLTITPSGGDATISGRLFADNIVNALNGFTGGVTLAAGAGISMSAATGSVTITNTGVLSFNGLTGAVGGVCAAQANTFTAKQGFSAGVVVEGGLTANRLDITDGGLIRATDNPLSVGVSAGTPSSIDFDVYGNITLNSDNNTPVTVSYDQVLADVRVIANQGLTASSLNVTGNAIVGGNLTVSGGVTFTVSENVLIEDNIIILNSNVTGSPSENAGIEIERGTSANVQLLWNESSDKWTFTNDGSTYYDLPTSVVTSFNGNTGAVTGASLGANTFTGLQTLNAGLTTAFVYASTGSTFASTVQVSGGATFSGRVDVGGVLDVVGGTTLESTLDVAGVARFAGGVTFSGTVNGATATFSRIVTASAGLSASGVTTASVTNRGTSLVLTGATTGGLSVGSRITLPGSGSEISIVNNNAAVNISSYVTGTSTFKASLKFSTEDFLNETAGSVTLTPADYADADYTLYLPTNTNGTLALTSQLMGAVNGSTAATTAVTSFNGLTGAVTGVTVGGANTFTALNSFNAGISAAGGTFGATAAFNSSIILQNSEFIQNTTNGRIDFMPAPASSTHYGMYLDFTSWGYGPRFGTIRSSDNATNTTGILWDAQLNLGNNVRFNFGANGQNGVVLSDTGNDTIQVFTDTTTGTNSGSLALVSSAGINHANRSPGTTHTNPNLYVYRAGTASANDFIRIEHDGTNANIVTGGSSAIDMEPGSGFVGFSGGISASGGITFSSTMRVAGTATFAGLINSTAGLSGTGITLSGNLSAATKSFVIPHPTKPQMTLQHGSLEGPENGVYVRGRLRGNDTITLPEYWRGLVHEDSITVNLTEIGDRNHHWVAYMGDYTITVASERGSVDCFYTVWGERKDVGKLPVEY